MRNKQFDWWQELILMVPHIDNDYQLKMEFARSFLKSCNVCGPDDTKIWMGSVRLETLTYFIYAIVTKYAELNGKSENSK